MKSNHLTRCFEKYLKQSKIRKFIKTTDEKDTTFYTFAFRGKMFIATYKESNMFRTIKIRCITEKETSLIKRLFAVIERIKPLLAKVSPTIVSCGTEGILIAQKK